MSEDTSIIATGGMVSVGKVGGEIHADPGTTVVVGGEVVTEADDTSVAAEEIGPGTYGPGNIVIS